MAKRKPMGRCPHCEKRVRAVVVEENTLRRDVLKCPKCKERVLRCVTPGCKNYAAGGAVYDDNLCPDCTSTGVEAASKVIKVGTDVAMRVAATALVSRAIDDDD